MNNRLSTLTVSIKNNCAKDKHLDSKLQAHFLKFFDNFLGAIIPAVLSEANPQSLKFLI